MKFLFKEISQKPVEYIVLAAAFIFASFLLYLFRFDGHHQRDVVYGLTAVYFAWSLHHHYKRGDLAIPVIVEYLLMALLALVLISGTLLPF